MAIAAIAPFGMVFIVLFLKTIVQDYGPKPNDRQSNNLIRNCQPPAGETGVVGGLMGGQSFFPENFCFYRVHLLNLSP